MISQRDEFSQEQVLLWNLGLDAETIDAPAAAVFYGRARRMGPLLEGEDVSERNLTGLLSIIGADCECGLDRSWMQGDMLLAKWDEAIQTKVAKARMDQVALPLMFILRVLLRCPSAFSSLRGDPPSYRA